MRGTAQRGFSLLEVVVAFAILAMSVTTLLALFGSGLRSTALANDYQRALLLAESRMNYLQGIAPQQLRAQSSQGELANGLFWRSEVSQYPDVQNEAGMMLYHIMVEAGWREGGRTRLVTLTTLRLGAAP